MTILTATSLSAAEAVAQLVRAFEEGRVFEILFATDLKHENKLQQSDNQTLSKQLDVSETLKRLRGAVGVTITSQWP